MDNLGLKRGFVRILPYKKNWAAKFSAERAELARALGQHALNIQHVGSTAVPGLAAKPIIDIAVAVSSLEIAQQLIKPLQELGYEYKGAAGVPNRRFFAKGPENHRTHYLHIAEIGTEFRCLILFRDLLIANADIASQYGVLKHDLADKFASDRALYTKGKNDFIEKTIAQGDGIHNAKPI